MYNTLNSEDYKAPISGRELNQNSFVGKWINTLLLEVTEATTHILWR